MENGYILDMPKYNSITGLYDTPIKIGLENKTINCYRLLNNTNLKYSEEAGYFLLSPDSKYIFIDENTDVNTFLKNIIFSKMHIEYTNKDLLEINNNPVDKYSNISLIEIPNDTCINLALEDNVINRENQIKNNNKYNQYDCLVKNISNISYTNTEPKTIMEKMTDYFIGSPSNTPSTECNKLNVVEVIHQYNTFYVYGLTSLNIIFVLIIIMMIFSLIKDSGKSVKKQVTETEF